MGASPSRFAPRSAFRSSTGPTSQNAIFQIGRGADETSEVPELGIAEWRTNYQVELTGLHVGCLWWSIVRHKPIL